MRYRACYGLFAALVLSLSACDRALEVPSDGGDPSILIATPCDAKSGSCTSAAKACSSISDESRCDAQLGCHTLRSGDLPCNNSDCIDHFVACLDTPAVCSPPNGSGSCKSITPTCRSGQTMDYSSGPCADGCVARGKCTG